MRCGIISSWQSAATSEIVKRSRACVHRGAVLYQVADLYLYLFNTIQFLKQTDEKYYLFSGGNKTLALIFISHLSSKQLNLYPHAVSMLTKTSI